MLLQLGGKIPEGDLEPDPDFGVRRSSRGPGYYRIMPMTGQQKYGKPKIHLLHPDITADIHLNARRYEEADRTLSLLDRVASVPS